MLHSTARAQLLQELGQQLLHQDPCLGVQRTGLVDEQRPIALSNVEVKGCRVLRRKRLGYRTHAAAAGSTTHRLTPEPTYILDTLYFVDGRADEAAALMGHDLRMALDVLVGSGPVGGVVTHQRLKAVRIDAEDSARARERLADGAYGHIRAATLERRLAPRSMLDEAAIARSDQRHRHADPLRAPPTSVRRRPRSRRPGTAGGAPADAQRAAGLFRGPQRARTRCCQSGSARGARSIEGIGTLSRCHVVGP